MIFEDDRTQSRDAILRRRRHPSEEAVMVWGCCGCSCDKCKNGHDTGGRFHSQECLDRFEKEQFEGEP